MKKIILVVGFVLILVVGLSIYNDNEAVNTQDQKTIKLGLMFPLTSPFSTVAEGVRDASLMAIADWEAENPGSKVEVVIEDDAYDPVKGISAYNKMKSIDKVQGIFSVSTPVLDALHKTYQADGLPVINLGVQTEGAVDDNIFQIFSDARGQMKPLADYIEKNTDYESVVIIHSTNDAAYSQFYNEFVKLYSKPFTEVVLNDASDSKVVANKTLATKSQAVIIILAPALGSLITKELKTLEQEDSNMDYYYEGSLLSGFDEYKKVLGDINLLNGATTLKTLVSDLTPKFKADFMTRYDVEAPIFSEFGYDSMMVLLNSYDEDKTVWVENIKDTNFVGSSGVTVFDERGIRKPDLAVTKIVNGQAE